MNSISITSDSWAGVFVVVRSFLGETRRYYGYTLKQAERAYRAEFGLTGRKLVHL